MTLVPTISIGDGRLSYRDVVAVALGTRRVALSQNATWVQQMQRTRAAVHERLSGHSALYGIKTGFGASCTQEVGAALTQALATNLFRYHGAGVGAHFAASESAAVLVTRLAQLSAGYSGIRVETMQALEHLLAAGVLPCMPEIGSVGASGDLTPMSYVAAVLEGEREAYWQGKVVPAEVALREAGLVPWQLQPKESLSIMNGTSVMTALASIGLARANQFARWHATITAWNSWLLQGQAAHFDERIFVAKPHPGSAQYAAWCATIWRASARSACSSCSASCSSTTCASKRWSPWA